MNAVKKEKHEREQRAGRIGAGRLRVIIGVGVLLAVAVLILTLLPFALQWAGERYLAKAGAREAHISNVNFNIITGRFSIFGLQAEGHNGDRLRLEKLEADADVLLLFKKRLRISDISLVGLTADIRKSEDGILTIGGLQAPASAAPDIPSEEPEPASWGIGVGTMDINDLQAHIIVPELEETFNIKHIHVKDFATWAPEASTSFLISATIFDAAFQLDGTAAPLAARPAADIRYNIAQFPLERLNPYLGDRGLTTMAGTVSINGSLSGSLATGSKNIDLQTSLSSGPVNIAMNGGKSPVLWKNEAISFRLHGSYSDTGTISIDNVSVGTDLSIDGVRILAGSGDKELINIGSLDLEKVQVSGPDRIDVDLVSLENVALLPRPKTVIRGGEPTEVVRLKNLSMTDISLENRSRLHANEVNIDSLLVWILLKEGGVLEPVELLPEPNGATPASVPAGRTDDAGPAESTVTVTIDRLALSGENSILFRDLDVKPPLTLEVDSLQMQLSEVDTNPASGHAGVALQAGMGKYTSLNVTGDVSAPWKDPDLDVDVKLSTLDLPSLTPYADRHMGYILKSGHLNTDLEINVKNGKLDVQSEIVVNRIDMDPIREKDEQRASERLGIPVNTALSLLKDKNDDIRLSIPVQGDLNDPEFDISDVLLSVTGNALKRGVSSYYKSLGVTILTGAVLPPGTFSVLGKVFKATTAVSFDPVIFQPLETGLSHEDEVFLDQLAQKLAEKPGTRLILCGKVTRPDIGALRERDFAAFQASDPSARRGTAPAGALGTPGSQAAEVGSSVADTSLQVPPSGPPSIEEVPLTEDEQGQLIELAKQRAMAVKDYLIEAGGLDPKRLFVCYSDVELEEGGPPPRVDLSI